MTSVVPVDVTKKDMSYNSIRNFSFDEFFELFKCTQLDISKFWLINAGYDADGTKKYVHLVIRACQIRPFYGPHLVSIYNPEGSLVTLWVNSLTHLRRNVFKFVDRLSFERSTYLIPFNDTEILIRIKPVRCFMIIPVSSSNTGGRPLRGKNMRREGKAKQQLLDSCLQTMVTYIDREEGITKQETARQLMDVVENFCERFLTITKATSDTNTIN